MRSLFGVLSRQRLWAGSCLQLAKCAGPTLARTCMLRSIGFALCWGYKAARPALYAEDIRWGLFFHAGPKNASKPTHPAQRSANQAPPIKYPPSLKMPEQESPNLKLRPKPN